LKLNKKSN